MQRPTHKPKVPPGHATAFPRAADAAAAARLIAEFAALGPAEREFAGTAQGAALLTACGGNAPYLSDLALRDSAALLACMAAGPEAHVENLLRELRELAPDMPRAALGAGLRKIKRRAALALAIADIGGLWTLERITGALSALAELSLRAALRHLLLELHEDGKVTLPYPEDP